MLHDFVIQNDPDRKRLAAALVAVLSVPGGDVDVLHDRNWEALLGPPDVYWLGGMNGWLPLARIDGGGAAFPKHSPGSPCRRAKD